MRGIDVVEPDEATLNAIRATGVDIESGRIADLTLAGTRQETMRAALEAMLASPQYDMVVTVVGSSARFQPEIAVKPIVDVGSENGRLAAFIVPEAPEALAMLRDAGIPVFRTPEACADSIAAAFARGVARALERPREIEGPSHLLDEIEGYELLSQLGVASAEAKAVNSDDEPDPALFPAAVKVLGRDIAHKTDLGGVELGIRSQRAPTLSLDRVVMQRMATGAVGELLLGYRIDPQAGPIIMVAAGGVMTELLQDRSVRMAPVDFDTAREMLAELKSLPLLTGFRGRPVGDASRAGCGCCGRSRPRSDDKLKRPQLCGSWMTSTYWRAQR